jgi:hypothetical protein
VTQVEIDKPTDEKPYWINIPVMQKLTRQMQDLEAIGVATMLYSAHVRTRKSAGSMTRKLSVTWSQ